MHLKPFRHLVLRFLAVCWLCTAVWPSSGAAADAGRDQLPDNTPRVGEITLFFPVAKSELVKGGAEYHRLVRFADHLALVANGRGLRILSIGSASAFGPETLNRRLSVERANAPLPILAKHLVNTPHHIEKAYGTGDSLSPRNVPMDVHLRYQHVRIVALFADDAAAPSAAAPEETPADTQADTPSPSQGDTYVNSVGMRFVFVPAGTFTMGSPPGETGRSDNERPHMVRITSGFFLQETEVTQQQWETVMGTTPAFSQNCGDDCPVERISWQDALLFVKALNLREETDSYRLPTEAQWEYACRAGTDTAFSAGHMDGATDFENPALDAIAWHFANARKGAHPVAQKQANPWGLYDMHGNVWEWCADWDGPYPFSEAVDPAGPDRGKLKIRRGGSWSHAPRFCRSAYRSSLNPEKRDPQGGFRVLKTQ